MYNTEDEFRIKGFDSEQSQFSRVAFNYIIVIFVISCLSFFLFFPWEIVVNARGIIGSNYKTATIVSPFSSKIKVIYKSVGEKVHIGEEILRMQPVVMTENPESIRSLLELNRQREQRVQTILEWLGDKDRRCDQIGMIVDLKAICDSITVIDSQIDIQKKSIDMAKDRKEWAHQQWALAHNVFERKKVLVEKGILSEVALVEESKNVINARSVLDDSQGRIEESLLVYKRQLSERERYLSQSVAEYTGERRQLMERGKMLERDVELSETNLEAGKIKSPVDGVVEEILPLFVGKDIREGVEFIRVVPSGGNTDVVVGFIDNNDAPYVRKGNQIRLRFDGLNASQYGVVMGEIISVDRDSVAGGDVYGDDKGFYRFTGRLSSVPPLLKKRLKSGLECRIEIITGKRTIGAYFVGSLVEKIGGVPLRDR